MPWPKPPNIGRNSWAIHVLAQERLQRRCCAKLRLLQDLGLNVQILVKLSVTPTCTDSQMIRPLQPSLPVRFYHPSNLTQHGPLLEFRCMLAEAIPISLVEMRQPFAKLMLCKPIGADLQWSSSVELVHQQNQNQMLT